MAAPKKSSSAPSGAASKPKATRKKASGSLSTSTKAAAAKKAAPSSAARAASAARTASAARIASAARTAGSAKTVGHLVIIESPGKVKTLTQLVAPVLGGTVKVKATVGHVRDLRKKDGVDVEHNFEPHYEVLSNKSKVVGELASAAKGAETVWLATDLDREGEAIAWHAATVMGLANGQVDPRVRRVTYSELTAEAIAEAFSHPRPIDTDLVNAYQARKVLDRLIGFDLSELMWKKVRGGLSAGRVQSVALRMVVDREREILAFVPVEYWSIDALLGTGNDERFAASVQAIDGRRVEIGTIPTAQDAARHVDAIRAAGTYTVRSVTKRAVRRNPYPPFTTSTLQSQASVRLGFSPRRTMALAQQLYEGVALGDQGQVGLITYMRTDSVNLAPSAVAEVREFIGGRFGDRYLPESARTYRSRKAAQEAHEAIRPTHVTNTPDAVAQHLDADQLKLYRLVWERTVACQMTEALFDQTTVDTEAGVYNLRATGRVMRFDGWMRLYNQGSDDATDDEADRSLPDVTDGQSLTLLDLTPDQHFTQPPPRYTEATLISALEENGIGRPSTYASTVSTLVERRYVRIESRRLYPEDVGFVVTDLLVEHFPQIVDLKFTAEMEDDLDEIAQGHKEWPEVLRVFYDPFSKLVEKKQQEITRDSVVRDTTDELCPVCEGPMVVKLGRWGKFLSCARYPECKGTRQVGGQVRPDPVPVPGETCAECGSPMLMRTGRYGEFLGCSRYPDCKYVKPKTIGGHCPKCKQGGLAERRPRRRGGRPFYGCTRYPDCDYTLWTRPVEQPCPSCGGTMTPSEERGVCLSCGHAEPLAVPAG